ncbi:phosphoribosyltransferase [Alteribacillus bidgolensis]|nr:phosphoribosyltransferase [Alteribacillus bidgolensis]
MRPEEKDIEGAKRHLDTIHLNPEYQGKLKGKKVVVLDDYTANGYSFECARNLLLNQGVKELIFVTIGTFQNVYRKEDFLLKVMFLVQTLMQQI